MTHKEAADYHRAAAEREVVAQGSGNADFVRSRMAQEHHNTAARAADAAHAAATGTEVVYTPIGTPVFRRP